MAMRKIITLCTTVLCYLLVVANPLASEQRNEVYPLRKSYNFATRKHYPQLYRQLSAAPFVHTLPVQLLIDDPSGARDQAEMWDQRLYEIILQHAYNPPTMPPSEEVLAPSWPLFAWKISRTMEWTHVLHDQLIDVLADDRVTNKKEAVDEAIRYYLKDPLAITPKPLNVNILSHFPYSHEFHHAYPKVMGIMMAYHWLQGVQHDVMLEPKDRRNAAISEAIQKFRVMLENPPDYFPLVHKAAPNFHRISSEGGYIFDNLHILHHITQDILITQKVPDQEKQTELYKILPLFLNVSATEEWFADGPQEEPPMPGAQKHHEHHH